MDKPRPHQVNLVVSDMEATVAFYRRLGLEIPDSEPPWQAWQGHHRGVKLDAAERPGDALEVEFDSVQSARLWDKGSNGGMAVLGFRVEARETVDEIYADLTGAGYRGQQSPHDAFWGSRYAVVKDPDGNAVGIMSDRDPAKRWEPPEFATD